MSILREEMVSRPDELAACCDYLASCPLLGFDTEFVGEDTYQPSLCLIQIATVDRLILIDPLTVGPLDTFWNLIIDPNRVVIVHAGREEVRLCRNATGRIPGNLFDLQLAAGLIGLAYPLSHASLVNQLLRVQIAKGETLTEWRQRPLTPAQIGYAYDDVRYLIPLYQKIMARLEKLDRVSWVREEFEWLAQAAAPDDPVGERWRKLRGIGGLDRRRLAAVRALFAWREEMAAKGNRPARTILRDDLIIEIARRNPTNVRDLEVVRGLPKRDLEPIVKTILEARTLTPEQCPEPSERDQDLPQVTLVTNILLAVLGDLCARRQLAPNLVANTADVRLLVRARYAKTPLPDASGLTQGWRADYILPDLLAVLEGKRSLRIQDVRAEAPLAYEGVGE